MAGQYIMPRPQRVGLTTPLELPNNAAWYSLSGPESDTTYLTNGLGRVKLVADRSGNSSEVAVASNGGASNTVTASNKSVTGNQVFTWNALLSTFTPAADVTIFSKLSGNNGCELLLLTTGVVRLRVGDGAAITNYDTTTGMSAAANTRRIIAVTYVDGGSGSLNVTVDGVALGTAVATVKTLTNAATTATFLTTATIGVIFRTQVGSVYDMNPAGAAKLGGTFTGGGDTYTVTTSGDAGVRLSGARDLYQGTTAKMPLLSVDAAGYNIATFDGSNDFMAPAPYSVAQPFSLALVASQVAWADGAILWSGGVGASTDSQIRQRTTTPNVALYAGSGFTNTITGLALGVRGVLSAVFNSASSTARLNQGAAATGDPGTFTIDRIGIGGKSTGLSVSNITFSELLLRSVANDAATELKIAGYESRKWGVN
jgi:hypothetical protein